MADDQVGDKKSTEEEEQKERQFAGIAKPLRDAMVSVTEEFAARGHIDRIASLVFLLSAVLVGLILLLAVFVLVPDVISPVTGNDDNQGPRVTANLSAALYIRIASIGLTILAVSVVTALIARFPSAWSIVFGLVVIGALIVPANDIVRFVLLISGSERAYSEFYRSENPARIRLTGLDEATVESEVRTARGKERCTVRLIDDVVLYELERDLQEQGIISRGPEWSDKQKLLFYHYVSAHIGNYTARESINNVLVRGASETLRAIVRGEGLSFATAYENSEKVREHMLFLRSEGLVSFPFDRIETAEATAFGILAYQEIATKEDLEKIQQEALRQGNCLPVPSEERPFSPSVQDRPPSDIDNIEEIAVGSTSRIELTGSDMTWRKLEIEREGPYTIRAFGDGRIDDPFMVLFNDAGERLAADDDGDRPATQLGSRITLSLQPGIYLIGVRDLDERGVAFRVEVTAGQGAPADEPSASGDRQRPDDGPNQSTE